MGINVLGRKKWGKGARKLHIPFGHASKEKIQKLTEEKYGKKKRKKKGEDIEGCRKVCDECETCIKFRRNPDKPVVGFALGKVFNKVVRVDVEELEGEKFLVMINLMINEVGCKSKELFQFEYEGWVLTKPTSVWEKSHSAYLIGRGKPSCFEMGERQNT